MDITSEPGFSALLGLTFIAYIRFWGLVDGK
jgi:hypothetical protein